MFREWQRLRVPRQREWTTAFCALEARSRTREPVHISLKPHDVGTIENEIVISGDRHTISRSGYEIVERIETVFPAPQQNNVLHQMDGLVHLAEPSAVIRVEMSGR